MARFRSIGNARYLGLRSPPPAANDNDLSVMRRIDELFTAWPFLGSRRMTALLRTSRNARRRGHPRARVNWQKLNETEMALGNGDRGRALSWADDMLLVARCPFNDAG